MDAKEKECIDCGNTPRRKGYRRCASCVYKKNKHHVDKWNSEHPERAKELARKSRYKRYGPSRDAAIKFLGGSCASCGISDERVLDVDHIFGGGTKERRRKDRITFYKEVLNSSRDDVQLLCLNCHRIKSITEHKDQDFPLITSS